MRNVWVEGRVYEKLEHQSAMDPTVDEVDFKSLYRKQHYEARTEDGWTLTVTRYRPLPQPFHQPLFGEPLLLVHGFSQNRHAWTSGQFVKNLLFFGLDIHIAELRGHGLSSIEAQRRIARERGWKLPADLEYGWDIDSYFSLDLPAIVSRMKREVGRSKIFYCGHSMGGMLGYGLAGRTRDLEGLITIGAASELGRGFVFLKALALAEPALARAVDSALAIAEAKRRGLRQAASAARTARRLLGSRDAPVADAIEEAIAYRYVPMDEMLGWVERTLLAGELARYRYVAPLLATFLTDPSRAALEDMRWLLREGSEREPRGVLSQFARWIRRGEFVCYRDCFDFSAHFDRIHIPMAIIFGDKDKLASMRSTASVYRAAKSSYLLWRPVKGNSHVELTMGHDIRQICYDVKNLIEFAVTHRNRRPHLPRLDADPHSVA